MSRISTEAPCCRVRQSAMFTASVVLPTPPFMLIKLITFILPSPSRKKGVASCIVMYLKSVTKQDATH